MGSNVCVFLAPMSNRMPEMWCARKAKYIKPHLECYCSHFVKRSK